MPMHSTPKAPMQNTAWREAGRSCQPSNGKIEPVLQILLDGHDIRGLELQWLRSNIGLVGQEPLLFSCSIRENICYGCPEATEEQVLSAAADSNALTFIQQLPEGLNTQVRHEAAQEVTLHALCRRLPRSHVRAADCCSSCLQHWAIEMAPDELWQPLWITNS